MKLVVEVVGMGILECMLDGVIYLMDLVDFFLIFFEVIVFKCQCVIYGKFFIFIVVIVCDWIEIECVYVGFVVDWGVDDLYVFEYQILVLIVYDVMKLVMLVFVVEYFEVLLWFCIWIGIGIIGQCFNVLVWSWGWLQDQVWVECYQSGLMGGDVQIVDCVLEGYCQWVIFFEDLYVVCQYEVDIQLFECVVIIVIDQVVCIIVLCVVECWVQVVVLCVCV